MNAGLVRAMEQDLAARTQREQLYVPDRRLFWRLAPGVQMEVENAVLEMRGAPLRWAIRTNALGFRGADASGAAAGLRILSLGDSCTFGFRVAEDDTYPARLARICAERSGDSTVSVLNAGVPGYTSHQGRVLFASLVDVYRPDVVTIAFGANDRETDVLSDAQRAAWLDTFSGRLAFASSHLAVYRVIASLLRPTESTPSAPRRRRVEVEEFRANIAAMIDTARRASAHVVLIDLEYVDPIYSGVLRELAAREDLPLLDGRTSLDDAYERIVRGEAYADEVAAWRRFYTENVVAVRPVYFDRAFYERHYATERAQQQFITLMADPVHPNGLGHRVLAEALAPLVCPPSRGRR